MRFALLVNGQEYRLDADSRTTLLDALREQIGLTGTKKGCDHGQCGACTVHLDGRSALSCLTLAVSAQGCAVTTVEGLLGENGGPGGTALLDLMKLDVMRPGHVGDINALAQFGDAGSITAAGPGLRLGALTRMSEAAEHPEIKRNYLVLSQSLLLAASSGHAAGIFAHQLCSVQ